VVLDDFVAELLKIRSGVFVEEVAKDLERRGVLVLPRRKALEAGHRREGNMTIGWLVGWVGFLLVGGVLLVLCVEKLNENK